MKTFTKVKEFVRDEDYKKKRQNCIAGLKISSIDKPIANIIKGFLKFPYCFTMQSCYGHFLYEGEKDLHNIKPLPVSKDLRIIEYRIAYIAFCLENSAKGRELFKILSNIPELDSRYIQFGCAEWFWNQYPNSYVLQVEPERFKNEDKVFMPYKEALHIENLKKRFFKKVAKIVN